MPVTDPLQELYDSVDPSVFESNYPSSERQKADMLWVRTHREELAQYEGKWIAVYNQQVIASGKNGANVQKRALQKIGYDVPDLYLRFLEHSTCVY